MKYFDTEPAPGNFGKRILVSTFQNRQSLRSSKRCLLLSMNIVFW